MKSGHSKIIQIIRSPITFLSFVHSTECDKPKLKQCNTSSFAPDGGALEHMVGMVTGCGTRTDGGDGGGLAQMVWWGWWVTHTDGGDSEGLA